MPGNQKCTMDNKKRTGPGPIFRSGPHIKEKQAEVRQEGVQSILTRSVRLMHSQLIHILSQRGTAVNGLINFFNHPIFLFYRTKIALHVFLRFFYSNRAMKKSFFLHLSANRQLAFLDFIFGKRIFFPIMNKYLND